MSTCKRCGCEFDYDLKRGTGYAPDLCGSYCDGVYHERQVSALKIAGLMTQIDELRDERDALAKRLAVKCEHPNTEQCCKLWEADTARRQLEGVDAKLSEEFDWGCDTVEHLATALVAARAERDALAAEIATLRRRWNHVAGLAQTMGLKMDGQNSWRFRPLYNGFGPTIEAAVDDAIERIEKARNA